MRTLVCAFLISASFVCATARAGPAPSALYVGFTTAGNSVIGVYPPAPQVVPFGKEFAAATDPQSFTIAGGKLYWVDGVQVLEANLDGSGLSVLDTFGIGPTSIAVNSAGGQLYVGFTTAGNSVVGVYPLTPQVVPFGKEFAAATDPQSFTIAGGKLYWVDGVQVLEANLDGSGLSVLDTFGIGPTSIAVNSAGGQLYVGFTTAGSNDIGVYPLTPEATGKAFAAATDPQSLTIAGGKLYWIDGVQVLDANLDGSGLSVLDTFGIGPTSIAVSVAPSTVPEASTWAMMLLGFAGLGLSGYRASQRRAAVAV